MAKYKFGKGQIVEIMGSGYGKVVKVDTQPTTLPYLVQVQENGYARWFSESDLDSYKPYKVGDRVQVVNIVDQHDPYVLNGVHDLVAVDNYGRDNKDILTTEEDFYLYPIEVRNLSRPTYTEVERKKKEEVKRLMQDGTIARTMEYMSKKESEKESEPLPQAQFEEPAQLLEHINGQFQALADYMDAATSEMAKMRKELEEMRKSKPITVKVEVEPEAEPQPDREKTIADILAKYTNPEPGDFVVITKDTVGHGKPIGSIQKVARMDGEVVVFDNNMRASSSQFHKLTNNELALSTMAETFVEKFKLYPKLGRRSVIVQTEHSVYRKQTRIFLRNEKDGELLAFGVARTSEDDVFIRSIGEALALSRALNRELPKALREHTTPGGKK